WILGLYERSLRWVLAHQPATLLVTVGTLLLTALLAVVIPKGFFPLQDTGLIVGVSVAQPDASFARLTNLQRTVDETILSDPDVASVASSIGAAGVNPTSTSGRVSITVKPRSQRHADVASDEESDGLQLKITIDRDTASRLGVSPQAVDDTLYDAFGQRQVTTIFTQLNQYRVILELEPEQAQHPEALDRLYVRTQSGDQVPFSAFAQATETLAPLAMNHQGQFPAVTISFNLAKGSALGEAVDAINALRAELGLPPGVRSEFAGTAQAFR